MSLFIFNFEKSRKYGMKKAHAVSFVVFFIATLIAFESLNRFFIFEKSRNFTTLKSFENQKETVEMLFLGDSHFLAALDSEQFGRGVFNLSFGGANYIESYYILKRYIEEMPSLKLVVLPVELHSFSSFRTDMFDNPASFWDRFIDHDELSKVKGRQIRRKKYNFTLFDVATGRKFFLENLRDSLLKSMRKEGVSDEEAVREVVLRRADFHFKGYDVFDKDLLFYFEKTLKLCRERGVLTVVVQLPLAKDYIDYAARYISPADIRERVLDDKKYGGHIDKYFDFSGIYSDKDRFFYKEGDHLDAEGSMEFSKVFSGELEKLLKKTKKGEKDG